MTSPDFFRTGPGATVVDALIVQIQVFAEVEVLTLFLGDSEEKASPVTEMNRGSVFGLFRGRRSAEKVSYQRGHFFEVLLQCEVTCVEEMEFGVFQILCVEPRALDRKNPIILSPND